MIDNDGRYKWEEVICLLNPICGGKRGGVYRERVSPCYLYTVQSEVEEVYTTN
jgi:hypothetical protein